MNALSRVMEDALRADGIPYVIARGTAYYQREEVKTALAYLRLVANTDDDVSLERIANVPARGVGKTTIQKVQASASEAGVSMFAMMRRAGEISSITARAVQSIGKFVAMVEGWSGTGRFMGAQEAPPEGALADLVGRVIRESGLEEMYAKRSNASGTETDAERLANLEELVSSARQFEDEYDPEADPARAESDDAPMLLSLLRAYLESVSLVADADTIDPARGAVTLMTLHAAKGLEFPAIAIIGLEEGILPHGRARESEADLEEERRLCFVGITRAMSRLIMMSARYRTQRGVSEQMMPSRFLEEFGREHVNVRDMAPIWGDGGMDTAHSTGPGRRRDSGVRAGAIVRHPRFGLGEVVEAEPGRVRIRFRDVGTKTLLLEYARLEIVEAN